MSCDLWLIVESLLFISRALARFAFATRKLRKIAWRRFRRERGYNRERGSVILRGPCKVLHLTITRLVYQMTRFRSRDGEYELEEFHVHHASRFS